jgi:hypothetical protein
MCPACIATTAPLVAGVSLAGGLAALAMNPVRQKGGKEISESADGKEMNHAE